MGSLDSWQLLQILSIIGAIVIPTVTGSYAVLRIIYCKGRTSQKDADRISFLEKRSAEQDSELVELKQDIADYRKGVKEDIDEIKLNQAKILGKLSILVPDKEDGH